MSSINSVPTIENASKPLGTSKYLDAREIAPIVRIVIPIPIHVSLIVQPIKGGCDSSCVDMGVTDWVSMEINRA